MAKLKVTSHLLKEKWRRLGNCDIISIKIDVFGRDCNG